MTETSDSLVRLGDPDTNDILADYGPLKVGSRDAIAHYGELLAEATADVIGHNESVVSAPPYATLPAAANLLAADVATRTAARLGRPVPLLRLTRAAIGSGFFETHYAGRDRTGRELYLDETVAGWRSHPGLAGVKVVFINDVRITGAQQRRQREFFARHGVTAVHWQYLAASTSDALQAGTEENLNRLGLDDETAFVELLGSGAWTPTTKALWRLFGLDDALFDHAIATMPSSARQVITDMLLAEHVPRHGRVARWASTTPPEGARR